MVHVAINLSDQFFFLFLECLIHINKKNPASVVIKNHYFLIANPKVTILTSNIVHLWYKNSPVGEQGRRRRRRVKTTNS